MKLRGDGDLLGVIGAGVGGGWLTNGLSGGGGGGELVV